MKRRDEEVAFEDSLNDDWSRDLDVAEVPLGNKPFFYLGIAIFCVVAAVVGRTIYLDALNGGYYAARAADNVTQYETAPAPRGVIYDRESNVIAENKTAFAAVLDAREFVNDTALDAATVQAAENILGVAPDDLASLVNAAAAEDFATPIVLADDITQNELVNLQADALPTIKIESDFARVYPSGPLFSSVVGYVGRVSQSDLKSDPTAQRQRLHREDRH